MNNPFPFSNNNRRFYTYDYYLKNKYGKKCFKVPLDGGFTCPNIDGTKGYGGCIYCSKTEHNRKSIQDQFVEAKEKLHKKWPDAYYIAYFQFNTNTYAPTEYLEKLYNEALLLPDVVGINISTRADSLNEDSVLLLRELSKKTNLTIELGLQTVHDKTAEIINRCCTYGEFLDGYNKLSGINRFVHIINGLPGENEEMMIQTVKTIASLHPDGIKIHLLHVLKNTALERLYIEGKIELLTLDNYVDIVVKQLELLPPDIIIARLTGDGLQNELVAPEWSKKKFVVMNEIDKKMSLNDTWQGKFYM